MRSATLLAGLLSLSTAVYSKLLYVGVNEVRSFTLVYSAPLRRPSSLEVNSVLGDLETLPLVSPVPLARSMPSSIKRQSTFSSTKRRLTFSASPSSWSEWSPPQTVSGSSSMRLYAVFALPLFDVGLKRFQQYFKHFADAVNYITLKKGAYAIIDPHNYMRYKYVSTSSKGPC